MVPPRRSPTTSSELDGKNMMVELSEKGQPAGYVYSPFRWQSACKCRELACVFLFLCSGVCGGRGLQAAVSTRARWKKKGLRTREVVGAPFLSPPPSPPLRARVMGTVATTPSGCRAGRGVRGVNPKYATQNDPPRRADHFDCTYVGGNFMKKKNSCGAFGAKGL